MNKLAITTEIRSILLDSEEITSLIGKKIFPVVAPLKTEGDFIIISVMVTNKNILKWALPGKFLLYF